jgi:hypothetical protein
MEKSNAVGSGFTGDGTVSSPLNLVGAWDACMGSEVDEPEAVFSRAMAGHDNGVVVLNNDLVFVKGCNASVVTQQAYRNEGGSHVVEQVHFAGFRREIGQAQGGFVGAGHGGAVGHCDMDWITGRLQVEKWLFGTNLKIVTSCA